MIIGVLFIYFELSIFNFNPISVTFLFLSVTVITVIMFLDVAKKWPNLMNKWTEVDLAMNSYGFPKNLQKKMIILTVVIMGAAVGKR